MKVERALEGLEEEYEDEEKKWSFSSNTKNDLNTKILSYFILFILIVMILMLKS